MRRKTSEIATVVLLSVALALTVVTGLWFLFVDAGGVRPSTCDDGNMCTVDIGLGVPVTCEHRPAVKTLPCNDGCYAQGKCDGMGHCANADPTACKGYCDTENDVTCDNLFAWNDDMLSYYGYTYPTPPETVCFADTCQAIVPMFWGLFGLLPITGISDHACIDLLDVDFLAANRSCIHIETWLLDWSNVDLYFDDDPVTVQACAFSWKCSRSNIDLLAALSLSSMGGNTTTVSSTGTGTSSNRTRGGPHGRNVSPPAINPRVLAANAQRRALRSPSPVSSR
jgi:hypothetical protein